MWRCIAYASFVFLVRARMEVRETTGWSFWFAGRSGLSLFNLGLPASSRIFRSCGSRFRLSFPVRNSVRSVAEIRSWVNVRFGVNLKKCGEGGPCGTGLFNAKTRNFAEYAENENRRELRRIGKCILFRGMKNSTALMQSRNSVKVLCVLVPCAWALFFWIGGWVMGGIAAFMSLYLLMDIWNIVRIRRGLAKDADFLKKKVPGT